MATERNVVDFKIHNLTEEQFQELKAQGKIDPNAIYCTPDITLKTNQITNCITHISQDIKLELANGVLTLKAGSKVYVPNGVGVFDQITMANDKILTQNWNSTEPVFIAWYDNSLTLRKITEVCSGATDTISDRFHWWYDTTNNVIKEIESGGTARTTKLCLPLSIITMAGDNTATVASIDQVFNGFGYIGSTIFALPGIKGLAPNGRNADGSLRNTEFTTGSVLTQTLTNETFDDRPVILRANVLGFNANASYDNKTNTLSTGSYVIVGTGSAVGGKITSLNTKTTFHAVDYNDFETLSDTVETLSDTVETLSDTVETLSDTVETNNDNAVHKTGDETIGGIKTFSSTIGTSAGTGIAIAGTDYSYTMRSSGATPNGCGLFLDNSADSAAFNATNTKITVGSNNIVPCAITPPSSDNSTRIATTAFVKSVLSSSGNGLATFSKGQTGYYKFNNGLIIQWGRAGQATNERTINFPTSFTNTNYAIVANPVTSGTTESFYSIATDEARKNTSSCVLRCSGHINTVPWLWIAIGY